MEKNEKIFVAGHKGLVGSAILKRLRSLGYTNIITRSHEDLDLCNQKAVNEFFDKEKIDYVFLAAAHVGGIGANSSHPARFIYDNMMIGFNVVHASYKTGVKKLMNLGSTCIYPKMAPQPLKEEYLLTGALEPTNDAYAISKISVIQLCKKYNSEYGTNFLSVMPTNLYGPGDNYDLEGSHVLPAMIRKFDDAKKSGADTVTLWGDGSPLREFLYSEDLADAVVFLMQHKNAADLGESAFVNVGSGQENSIAHIAQMVQQVVYADVPERTCTITWDKSKPNGTPRKLCDISRLTALGWKPKTNLKEGIALSYKDYQEGGGILTKRY